MKFRGLFGIGIHGESGTIARHEASAATARLEPMQTGGYGGYDSGTRLVLSFDDPGGIVGFWLSYDGNDWRWFDCTAAICDRLACRCRSGSRAYFQLLTEQATTHR